MTCDRSVVFPGTPVSSTNKTDRHDIITEILLKVTLNTLTLTLLSVCTKLIESKMKKKKTLDKIDVCIDCVNERIFFSSKN